MGKPSRSSCHFTVNAGESFLVFSTTAVAFPGFRPTVTVWVLKNMNYRARAIGATLQFRPRDLGGTAMICTLPRVDGRSK